MAFRHTDLGRLVAEDPAQAVAQLRALLERFGTVAEVARQLQVDRRTLARWIAALEEKGYEVPARPPGRRPGEPKSKDSAA
jgi:transposase-like protein